VFFGQVEVGHFCLPGVEVVVCVEDFFLCGGGVCGLPSLRGAGGDVFFFPPLSLLLATSFSPASRRISGLGYAVCAFSSLRRA